MILAHALLYAASGLCCTVCVIASGWLAWLHINRRRDLIVSHYTLCVLALAPLYALLSLGVLVLPRLAPYMQGACELYEAVALLQFVRLLLHLFYHRTPHYDFSRAASEASFEERQKDPDEVQARATEHLFEECESAHLCCGLFVFQPSATRLRWLRACVWQYLFVRVTYAIVWIALYETDSQTGVASVSLECIAGVSISVAMYATFVLIALLEPVLWPHDPWLKFASLKIVIFFCFWQSVVLQLLGYLDALPLYYFEPWDKAQVQDSLDALLVCFQMAVLAVFHHWIFREDEAQRASPLPDILRETLSPSLSS